MKHAETSGHFIILMGERRFRAATRAGLKTLDAIVEKKRLTDDQKRSIQYIENRASRRPQSQSKKPLFFEDNREPEWLLNARACWIAPTQPSTILTCSKTVASRRNQRPSGVGKLPPLVAYELARLEDTAQRDEMLAAYLAGNVTATDIAKTNPKSGTGKASGTKKSASSNRTKKFTHHGLAISATLKRSHTNANLMETLEAWLEKLRTDGRSHKWAA